MMRLMIANSDKIGTLIVDGFFSSAYGYNYIHRAFIHLTKCDDNKRLIVSIFVELSIWLPSCPIPLTTILIQCNRAFIVHNTLPSVQNTLLYCRIYFIFSQSNIKHNKKTWRENIFVKISSHRSATGTHNNLQQKYDILSQYTAIWHSPSMRGAKHGPSRSPSALSSHHQHQQQQQPK